MAILNQPFNGQLGEILKDKIRAPYTKLTIISAFAKNSGVLRLKSTMEQFKANGGYIEAFIGIDAYGTSYEALFNLFELCDELYIVHSESPTTTFHSKVYMLTNDDSVGWVAVGSNNLTGGGLWTNFETAAYFEIENEYENYVPELNELIDQYKNPDYPCSKLIESEADLNVLLDEDYLRKEIGIQLESRANYNARQNNETQPRRFGRQTGLQIPRIERQATGTVITNSRGQAKVQAILPIVATNDSERMWFETRALTGGSRNILDLSKLGTVVQGSTNGTRYETDNASLILGGVAFFDVDPENTGAEKSIMVNYNGTDYIDCVIKFPTGELSNGSWRLQLKGQSALGQRLQRAGGDGWLRYKILVFEKIRTDYYVMSVLEENQLDVLTDQSTVVATNGSSVNSKKYGLL